MPRLAPGCLTTLDLTKGFGPEMSFMSVERQRLLTGHLAGGFGSREYAGMF